jgi:hypothetical protein
VPLASDHCSSVALGRPFWKQGWSVVCLLSWSLCQVCWCKHFFLMEQTPASGPGPTGYRGFTITLIGHTTLGRTPLDQWSDRRRDHSLTAHDTHEWQTSMPRAGFKSTILASDRPQNHALEEESLGATLIYTCIFKRPSKWNTIYDVMCIRYYVRGICGFLNRVVLSYAYATCNEVLVTVKSVVFCVLGFAVSDITNIFIDIVLK